MAGWSFGATRRLLTLGSLAVTIATQATPAMAQTDLTMLGGATGATVYCIQAGDLTNGLFVGTFLQTGAGDWEEHLKGGTFKFRETKRDELLIEIVDSSRSASVQFDFVGKTIKYSVTNPPQWKERYVISSAVDKEGSGDCVQQTLIRRGLAAASVMALAPGRARASIFN